LYFLEQDSESFINFGQELQGLTLRVNPWLQSVQEYLPPVHVGPDLPGGQLQMKDPTVFTQLPPNLHGWFKHSFTSTENKLTY